MSIQLHDKTFIPFISANDVQQAVVRIARGINTHYAAESPVLLPMLDGAFMLAADLAKHLTVNAHFSFIKYKSYHNTQSTGKVASLLGLDIDIAGKDVIIVEDIIDTGLTVSYLLQELAKHNPASVKVAALLAKPDALQVPLTIDFKGIEIQNRFVVGYGMDYNGLGRNLDCVYVLDDNSAIAHQ